MRNAWRSWGLDVHETAGAHREIYRFPVGPVRHCDLTMWQLDCVTSWLCNEMTGSRCGCGKSVSRAGPHFSNFVTTLRWDRWSHFSTDLCIWHVKSSRQHDLFWLGQWHLLWAVNIGSCVHIKYFCMLARINTGKSNTATCTTLMQFLCCLYMGRDQPN